MIAYGYYPNYISIRGWQFIRVYTIAMELYWYLRPSWLNV